MNMQKKWELVNGDRKLHEFLSVYGEEQICIIILG